ncbi:hypothetical protein P0F65_09625 [Sphingomonas sp. I4]
MRRLTRLVNQLLTLMSIGNRRDVTGFTDLTASAAKVIREGCRWPNRPMSP